jgi:hypothetical protein
MKISPSVAAAGALLCAAALPLPSRAADDAGLRLFLKHYVIATVGADDLSSTRYAAAFADLNGDGRDEAVVYLTGSSWCGSGGCDALVLTPNGTSYDVVMDATVTQLPIGVLETSTQGWRDITVAVGGGGMPGGEALMRFDGAAYPDNPTAPPAEPLTGQRGTVLIPETDEGQPF